MAAKLILPSCEQVPTHPNHPPQPSNPLRIQIMGTNKLINSLFDDGTKMPQEELYPPGRDFPGAEFDKLGLRLAHMAFKLLYGRDANPDITGDFIPRHQYSTYEKPSECKPRKPMVDGYAITFDHLIDPADEDPETLMINLCNPADSQLAPYFKLDLTRYKTGPTVPVLLVPRCCQLRKGTTDRKGINGEVKEAKEGFRPPEVWTEVE